MSTGLLRADSVAVREDPIADTYDVEHRPFARGKFATVRRCRHLASGATRASKWVRKRAARRGVTRDEVLHEAAVLALSAPHPRIVRMHDVYETAADVVIVLELVEGGDLQRVLDEEEEVAAEAARLLRQILEGLAFLHAHSVAHLDIKPQNVLLTRRPLGDVKLCDFGISRLVATGVEIREIVGTPDYVAPEVLHYEPISLATDMWSMGVLAYVLVSGGHSPFGGECKQETLCNITGAALDFPPALFPPCSTAAARDFISRLICRDPRDRMTAEECLSHPWLTGGAPSDGIRLTLCPLEGGTLHNNGLPLNGNPPEDSEAEKDTTAQEGPRSQQTPPMDSTAPALGKGRDEVQDGAPESSTSRHPNGHLGLKDSHTAGDGGRTPNHSPLKDAASPPSTGDSRLHRNGTLLRAKVDSHGVFCHTQGHDNSPQDGFEEHGAACRRAVPTRDIDRPSHSPLKKVETEIDRPFCHKSPPKGHPVQETDKTVMHKIPSNGCSPHTKMWDGDGCPRSDLEERRVSRTVEVVLARDIVLGDRRLSHSPLKALTGRDGRLSCQNSPQEGHPARETVVQEASGATQVPADDPLEDRRVPRPEYTGCPPSPKVARGCCGGDRSPRLQVFRRATFQQHTAQSSGEVFSEELLLVENSLSMVC